MTRFDPPGGRALARAVVIVNGAMGVKQSFYRPFAQFLTTRGYSVLTWDYRGIGESVLDEAALREVTLTHWADHDLSLVLSVAAAAEPALSIVVVGHSFGGQIIALPDNRHLIGGALLIACPSGHVGHWRGEARRAHMWSLAYIGLPLLTRLFGRFPASRLGLGADLPRQVALQWGRWLRHPRYVAACASRSARIASFTAPIHAVSLSDDPFAPPAAVDAMLALYSGAPMTREIVAPEAHGLASIGHMGFFRAGATSLWTAAANRIALLVPPQPDGLRPMSAPP